MGPKSSHTDTLLNDVSRLGWTLLRRFSNVYRPVDIISAITGLSNEEFRHLRSLHYLTSSEVTSFVSRAAEFARSMPVASNLATRENRSFPKGRVDWIRTVRERSRRGGDVSFFVSRTPEASRDTPAAKLVAFLLSDVANTASTVLKGHVPEVARSELASTRSRALSTLRSLEGRGVRLPKSLRYADFSHLRHSRRSDVTEAFNLLGLRQSLLGSRAEENLRAIMAQRLYIPENLDDLFEVWTLLHLVQLHLQQNWVLTSTRLIGGPSSKRPRFEFKRGNDSLDLYYQSVPSELSNSSVYKDLFANYDLDVALRRPDIVLIARTRDFNGPLIVEVKRSENARYIVDSVYKVLGYLSDYSKNFGCAVPKALLVVAGGITAPATFPPDADVWIVPADRLTTFQLPY